MKDKAEKSKKRPEYEFIDAKDEVKRLNRLVGQLDGIRKMLEEQRKVDDVLIQCKAVHSGLRAIEQRLFKAHLNTALDELSKLDKKKSREERVAALEDLFKQAS